MKLECGKAAALRTQRRYDNDRKREWHIWFAWYPVEVGHHDCRWLERIERRRVYPYGWYRDYREWEYRV